MSLKMFEDTLLAGDLLHETMIGEYFWLDGSVQRPDPEEIAAVRALNADKSRFLLRYLRELWGTSDLGN